jgi:hypothetical protein
MTSQTQLPLCGKCVLILLVGALSMFFAEVCSGASVLWFMTIWAWVVTFWLYLGHLLLFVNLAFRFKRTSMTSFYLWGVLFGLYESWITKVTWAGYMGSEPIVGKFLGFSVCEFPLIVFFWHPIMSFIVPVLTFQALAGEAQVLPGHRPFLVKTRRNRRLAWCIVVIGATFLAINSKFSPLADIGTIAGSIAIIAFLTWMANRRVGQFSLESLRLGKKGMSILIVYLLALYAWGFFLMFPERIAPTSTLLMTVGVYAIIIGLIYGNGPDQTPMPSPVEGSIFGIKDFMILLAGLSILATVLTFAKTADWIMVFVLYVVLIIIAVWLMVRTTITVLGAWGLRKTHVGTNTKD